ncbi:hypothetical protein ACO0RG_004528 [Hanseniaspora osmophila]
MSDISNFTKAVTATATALFNHGSDGELLSSDSSYKTMLKDTLKQSESTLSNSIILLKKSSKGSSNKTQSTFLDLFNSENGKGYFRMNGKRSNEKANFRVMSYISDDLLHDIPSEHKSGSRSAGDRKLLKDASANDEDGNEQNMEPSLFQGFEATLAQPQKITDAKQHGGPLLLDAKGNTTLSLPKNFDIQKLQKTYSLSILNKGQTQLNDHLALLEIQKKIAATEISELDLKIKQLKDKRKVVFQRVATIEENESFVEKNMAILVERMDMIKEYNLDSESPLAGNESGQDDDDDNDTKNESNEGGEGREEIPKLAVTKESPKSPYKRKIQPTLQNFYQPNSLIHSFENLMATPIISLEFDVPFGTMCCAGEGERVVEVWDLQSHEKQGVLNGHLASVTCMQMEDQLLITAGRDAQIKLWNLNTMECVETLDSHIEEITAMSFDGETIVSGSQDRTLRQWDMQSGKCVQTIDMNFIKSAKPITSLSPKNPLLLAHEQPVIGAVQVFDAALATGTKDGIVRLWDLRSGQVVRTLEGHTDSVTSLKFDSSDLVTGSLDKTCRIWDLRMSTLKDLMKFEEPINNIELDPSKIVIGVDSHKRAKIYDRVKKELLDYTEITENFYSNSALDESSASETEEQESDENKFVTAIRYKDGYLLEGYANGCVSSLAI